MTNEEIAREAMDIARQADGVEGEGDETGYRVRMAEMISSLAELVEELADQAIVFEKVAADVHAELQKFGERCIRIQDKTASADDHHLFPETAIGKSIGCLLDLTRPWAKR